jgi:hypothetical protein
MKPSSRHYQLPLCLLVIHLHKKSIKKLIKRPVLYISRCTDTGGKILSNLLACQGIAVYGNNKKLSQPGSFGVDFIRKTKHIVRVPVILIVSLE